MTSSAEIAALEVPEDVRRFRTRFPIFETKVHLATNSKGALSDAAIAAHDEYLASWRDLGAPWDAWMARHERLRSAFAALIGAKPSEVGLCPSVSSALGAVASSLDCAGATASSSTTTASRPSPTCGTRSRRAAPASGGCIPTSGGSSTRISSPPPSTSARGSSRWRTSATRTATVSTCPPWRKSRTAQGPGSSSTNQSAGSGPLDVRAAGIDVLTTGTVKFLLGHPASRFSTCARNSSTRSTPRSPAGSGSATPATSSRAGNIRAAFHYYNTPGDVDALVTALEEIEPLLVRAA